MTEGYRRLICFTGKITHPDLVADIVYFRRYDDGYTLLLGLGRDINGTPSGLEIPHHYDAIPENLRMIVIDYVSSLYDDQKIDYLWNKLRRSV